MPVTLQVFILIVSLYFVIYFYTGDPTFLIKYLIKYSLETLSLFLFFGAGLILIAKTYAMANILEIISLVTFYFNSKQFYTHEVMIILHNSKRKVRPTQIKKLELSKLCREVITRECKFTFKFLKSTLEEIQKSYISKRLNSFSVIEIFNRELISSRQIIFSNFIRLFENYEIENYKILADAYMVKMEEKHDTLYKTFYLLGKNKRTLLRSIEAILNQFYIIYSSIDMAIIKFFEDNENQIIFKEDKNDVH